jgi:TRAP-type C4-dicarboxylate transport system substrate-binding protein
MEKRCFVILAVVSFLALFFARGNVVSAADKPIELKLSHIMSPMHHLHVNVFVPFAKEVEERTKGRVKISLYPAEAMGKAKDHYDMALTGITDISYVLPSYTAGRFPLTGVMELPIGVPSAKVGSLVIWDLYSKYLKSEYPGVKFLTIWTNQPGHIYTNKKQVKTLEDLKGQRVRSPGPQQTALLKELGGSPLTMPIPELYDALQRGMVDGTITDFTAVKDFKLFEVLKYATISNLYVLPMMLVMNQKVWDGLPSDVKPILEELTGRRLAEQGAATYDKNDLVGQETCKKAGMEIIQLSPEQKRLWGERMKPLSEKWVTEMESKGRPGKKVLEETRLLLEKYSK